MSAEYEGQDPLDIAKQAESDLNSHEAKHGHGSSQSGRLALYNHWLFDSDLYLRAIISRQVDRQRHCPTTPCIATVPGSFRITSTILSCVEVLMVPRSYS